MKLLDPTGALDLWDELREESCADLELPDMPTENIEKEEKRVQSLGCREGVWRVLVLGEGDWFGML